MGRSLAQVLTLGSGIWDHQSDPRWFLGLHRRDWLMMMNGGSGSDFDFGSHILELLLRGGGALRLLSALEFLEELGGNSIKNFGSEKQPQYWPKNWPEVPLEKDTFINLLILDFHSSFSADFTEVFTT